MISNNKDLVNLHARLFSVSGYKAAILNPKDYGPIRTAGRHILTISTTPEEWKAGFMGSLYERDREDSTARSLDIWVSRSVPVGTVILERESLPRDRVYERSVNRDFTYIKL